MYGTDVFVEWEVRVVKSLGQTVRQIMRDPKNGFTLMTILELMAKVRGRYGKMRKNTKNSCTPELNKSV
jgi:hypothetical protein